MVHRKLSMGFEKWQRTAAEMKGQEMALRRGVMRMVHGKLAGALGTWRLMAAKQKAVMGLADRALRRMQNGVEAWGDANGAWEAGRGAGDLPRHAARRAQGRGASQGGKDLRPKALFDEP
jgi:hypothetical protein